MKILTVRQPWATAIATGLKTVENRTWRTTYRGPLAIHAGRALANPADYAMHPDLATLDRATLPVGQILAITELTDVHRAHDTCPCTTPYAEPQPPNATKPLYHWTLTHATPLTNPVPYTGGLSLRTPNTTTMNAITKQIRPDVGDASRARAHARGASW